MNTPTDAAAFAEASELSRLRSEVSTLESEREMRKKLEKLLEVQKVQNDLHKELRVKTESLLQVEQQTTSRLRGQLEQARAGAPQRAEGRSQAEVERRFIEAQKRITELEGQLQETAAPETSDRAQAQLQKQLEEQERIIQSLKSQMQEAPQPNEAVRLQTLLQARDRQTEELTQALHNSQNEAAEARSESEVLKHQVRVLKKEVAERTDEMERQLSTERSLRADVFQHQATIDKLTQQINEEAQRATGYAATAATADDAQVQARRLEKQLAEEQMTSQRERERVINECDFRMQQREQTMKNQTTTIESLNRELREKQAEIDKLLRTGGGSPDGDRDPERSARVLPPLAVQTPRPPAEEIHGQRSLESLHKQLRAKDAKIAKQTERLQNLTEMLEKRDQQLEELSTARRDRELMRQKLSDAEDAMRTVPRVVTHAEAERRLLEQEQRLYERERKVRELEEGLQQESVAKDSLSRELGALRGQMAEGASGASTLQQENDRLSRELAELRRQHDGRVEELRRAREAAAETQGGPPPMPAAPTLHRKLQRLEEMDKTLARDVAVFLQDRENKIESLNSTISLLRTAADEARRAAAAGSQAAEPQLPPEQTAPQRLPPLSLPVAPPSAATSAAPSPSARRPAPSPLPEQPRPASRQSNQAPAGQACGQSVGRSAPSGAQPASGEIEDLRNASADDLRSELLSRRKECSNLEHQMGEKQQLVLRLIEEANLCNAEVASLQQTVQQAANDARKQARDYELLVTEKDDLEKLTKELQQTILDKEQKVANLLMQHQTDTSGNASIDEIDKEVTWKLPTIVPRKHEIRHSLFVVLNRHNREPLNKGRMEAGLANMLAISAARVEFVQDSMLTSGHDQSCSSHEDGDPQDARPDSMLYDYGDMGTDFDEAEGIRPVSQTSTRVRSELVLVNIVNYEVREDGSKVPSIVSAVDALDHMRSYILKGMKPPTIDNVVVSALFLNHGDMVLPYEWPTAQAVLLMREGRLIAGKHSVLTLHEVRDPYVLRVVCFDTEAGRDYVLYLHSRDVLLLLDARDHETVREESDGEMQHEFLHGPYGGAFRSTGTAADAGMLDVIISCLSFSVWQGQQILVASEMRVPHSLTASQVSPQGPPNPDIGSDETALRPTRSVQALRDVDALDVRASQGVELMEHRPLPMHPAVIPEVGATRGFKPATRSSRLLYEDVISFEDKLCIFSLAHTTRSDLTEDVLRARVYYPKTSGCVEACLTEPMLSDRLRIVAEAGSVSEEDVLSVAIVIEEIIYPPSFVVRITSICLEDAYKLSPKEEVKPHSHIIRITKDTANVLHCPDISFAVSPSTMRNKLLRCVCLSSCVEGPRETLLTMPGLVSVLGNDAKRKLQRKIVRGHVNDSCGLQIQLVGEDSGNKLGLAAKAPKSESEKPGQMDAVMRSKMREKFGKGKLLVRHGRMVVVKAEGFASTSMRAVVSVYERPEPYLHFVVSAYEPQTSREWEVLADSIDIFKLFVDHSQAHEDPPDISNPVVRRLIAQALVESAELHDHRDELSLMMSPTLIRQNLQKAKDAFEQEPERTSNNGGQWPSTLRPGMPETGQSAQDKLPEPIEPFEVQPALSRQLATAIGGFTGGFADREDEVQVDKRLADLLFTGQRRLNPQAGGMGDAFKIQIYDKPSATALHSYVVVATPINNTPAEALNLPVSDPAPAQKNTRYVLRVDDKALEGFLWDTKLLDPSRQEELLHYVNQSLHLDADRMGQLRLNLRKHKHRMASTADTLALIGESGSGAPAHAVQELQMVPEGGRVREVGGCFTLNRLNVKQAAGRAPKGPSLREPGPEGSQSIFLRDWRKVYSRAQRFGSTTIVITVSRRDRTYKLSVYEPETSTLYEMSMSTASVSTPYNMLLERCDLAGKLDLVLVMCEMPFPHQISIYMVSVGSPQEFNLNIADDLVYSMLEGSRREALVLFMAQLITWGCIGFHATPGQEEEATADVWEETFAGNQIFDRTPVTDVLQAKLTAHTRPEHGDLKSPGALPLAPVAKLRVPVVRTTLDNFGRKPPTTTVVMQLLYHGEKQVVGSQENQHGTTALMRVHRRASTGDIAVTLRTRHGDLALPQLPDRCQVAAGSANGRPFTTPALGAAEGTAVAPSEVTIWLQDKSSRSPCGAYGEVCEVPGIDQPLLVMITDEDSPRAVRICVTLSRAPFSVLFQVVLLEKSEVSARIDAQSTQKSHSGRRVLGQVFSKRFGLRKGPCSSLAITQLSASTQTRREHNVRELLDELDASEDAPERIGFSRGKGKGGPTGGDRVRQEEIDEGVDTCVINISTRLKIGRMMIFTIFRDCVGHDMYLRVVMHDPVRKTDMHLTLMHYTTQRLLSILRVNRDMLIANTDHITEQERSDLQTLRAELGKIIIDHLYLTRVQADKEGVREVIDDLDLNDDDDLEYEMHMRDIMASSNAAHFTVKRRLLEDEPDAVARSRTRTSSDSGGRAEEQALLSPRAKDAQVLFPKDTDNRANDLEPSSLLNMKEENLIHKVQKVLNGRRVLVAFYNETTPEDIPIYSHNIRIVVACLQSLEVLYTTDLHEDVLEPLCAQREKRHLMSAAREQDLVQELGRWMVLTHVGTNPTGIKFASADDHHTTS